MFALIITLVSIALVAVLAIATIWYGGGTFTKGGAKAKAARVMNDGAQITGAIEAYKAQTGEVPTSIDALITAKFLAVVPKGDWSMGNDYIVAANLEEQQCIETNTNLGITGIPACDAPEVQGVTACCSTPG
jgi:hypothetical protein